MESEKIKKIEENEEVNMEKAETFEEKKREVAVPGEVIAKGPNFLPGEGARREGNEIIANRFGLVSHEDRLVKIIPFSGAYAPRRGNVVIGVVKDTTYNGWLININATLRAFLSITEAKSFVSKQEEPSSIYGIGDMLVLKVKSAKLKGIDLTMADKGLHRLDGGMIITINSNKVPRVIGKMGSMVNMIKTETNCNITVGQNGIIWIGGEKIEDELLAKEAIMMIAEQSAAGGLTEKVEAFLKKRKSKETQRNQEVSGAPKTHKFSSEKE